MRHNNHNHQLGVSQSHRSALLANLATQLITYNRIETTLAKAKALRPFIEKIITMAKKARLAEHPNSLHYRRLALAKVRSRDAINQLFNKKVEEFMQRPGGYTRIYKLVPRRGDAAPMGLIEMISASDVGFTKRSARKPHATEKAEISATAL